MAVRKETIKQQFNEALPAVLQPGEQVLGGAYGVSGPNPLWAIVGARLGPAPPSISMPAAGRTPSVPPAPLTSPSAVPPPPPPSEG